ncbi:MAG: hypothetical protein EAZ21_01600 [Betaproteobacteria bacterium]|nr:MAG: hypothetical protein EAZ21_01600 [Betaproteobacteria bacterium]
MNVTHGKCGKNVARTEENSVEYPATVASNEIDAIHATHANNRANPAVGAPIIFRCSWATFYRSDVRAIATSICNANAVNPH